MKPIAPQNDLLYSSENIDSKVKHFDWPIATLETLRSGEDLDDVEIVTLATHYHERCIHYAMNSTRKHDPFETEEQIDEWVHNKARQIMNNGIVSVQEMVQINDDYSGLVVIDVPIVNGDAIERALKMIEDAIEQGNVPGTTYFGDSVTWTWADYYNHLTQIAMENK